MKKLWNKLHFDCILTKHGHIYNTYYIIPTIYILINNEHIGWKDYGIGIIFLDYTYSIQIHVDGKS